MWIPPRGPGMALAAPPSASEAPPRRGLARLTAVLAEAVLVGLLGFVLFVAYGLIDNRWYHFVAVTGGSMAPTILPGDLLLLTRPPAEVKAGMILTLQVDGAVVTHRVVQVDADGTFVTQGDANDVRDDFRGHRVRVVGEVRLRIPTIGRVLLLGQAHEPSGAWFEQDGSLSLEAQGGSWSDREARGRAAATSPAPSPSSGPGADTTAAPRPRPTAAPAGPPSASAPPGSHPTAPPTAAAPTASPAPSPLVAAISCPADVTAGEAVTCRNESSSGPGISYLWYVDGAPVTEEPAFESWLEPGDHDLRLAVRRGAEVRWSNTVFITAD